MNTKRLTASLVLLPFGLTSPLFLNAQAPDRLLLAGAASAGQQPAVEAAATSDQLEQLRRSSDEQRRRLAEVVARAGQDQAEAEANRAILEAAKAADAAVAAIDSRTGTAILRSKDGKEIRLQQIVGRTRGADSSQAQVIAFSPMAPDKRAEITEDLNVMTKLVDDAVADQRDGSVPRAMGINLTTWASDGMLPRSFYIEGHGAIFQVAVRFPLKPSEKKESGSTPKPAKSSAWDEAKRELYGAGDADYVLITGAADGKVEEYSEERVESLKKVLLKALANANNFRHLSRDETITVVVHCNSGSGRRVATTSATPRPATSGSSGFGAFGAGGGGFGASGSSFSTGTRLGERTGGAGEQTMTIRVKKADADALAEGRITEDEFRNRATVTVY